ncbi:unnamed protein product [Euphydryas editha]|uniref:THAP-type domain-containing protein n=1 Tax=Euphydryas editha TaxID=104508 RepID=A0AAU9VDG0_EUPED|nr:unnamed protein product [Euphydryas editha]
MGLFKCCVGGCSATNETHRLFSFPKNDHLRNLWLSFLVPTNSILVGLSKEQLLRKRVCEKHFDKHQFDEEGKRLRYSYPCLFTDDEIAHGVPLSSRESVRNALSDHNYYKENSNEDINATDELFIIGRAGDDFHGHPLCLNEVAVKRHRDVADQPSCSFSKEVEFSTLREHSDSAVKKLNSKKRKFVKHVTKVTENNLGKTVTQRLEQAVSYGNIAALFNNFGFLSKQAQTFLLMQLKQCRKYKTGRRFTLDEKLTALVLWKQSPKSYRLLENMFALPNKRTLNRLSEKIIIEPGLSSRVFKYISNKTRNWNSQQKLCTIVFDEIALTPHLTYNEKADEINGFVDVAGNRKMRFCDHALVFMIRGVCSSWRQTVAFYFCEGTVSSASLQNILKQLVEQVAQTGLIPLGLVCDQGSTFRSAIKSLREMTIQKRSHQNEKDDGTIIIAGYSLSVFFDPPHLLKGLRNNFLSKNIIWKGKTATWKDIQFIYDLDSKLGHTRTLPKLTAHHVDPDKIKKMKVSVAAQVLSARTAAMLKYTNTLNHLYTGSSSSMETTAEVVEFFDELFDSVNCYPGGATKGKLRKAVKMNSPHVQFWTEAIKKLKELKYEDMSSKLALQSGKPRLVRVPSVDGWITTLESFIRITKILFEKYAVKYYYPRNVNQDPLENFFGRVRALNYRNVNPDANTFIYAYKSLLFSRLLSPHSKFANCEVDNGDALIDLSLLFEDDNNENNDNINQNIIPSTSQKSHVPKNYISGSITQEVVLEKIKVQCSAYTAAKVEKLKHFWFGIPKSMFNATPS